MYHSKAQERLRADDSKSSKEKEGYTVCLEWETEQAAVWVVARRMRRQHNTQPGSVYAVVQRGETQSIIHKIQLDVNERCSDEVRTPRCLYAIVLCYCYPLNVCCLFFLTRAAIGIEFFINKWNVREQQKSNMAGCGSVPKHNSKN